MDWYMICVQLGDFGLCRAENVTTTLPCMATWTHLPPECQEDMKENVRAYSCEYDVYSFGKSIEAIRLNFALNI